MTKTSRFVRCAFASVFVVGIGSGGMVLADDVIGDPNNGYGPNNRPAFLLVSISETFDVPVIPLTELGAEDIQAVRVALDPDTEEPDVQLVGSPLVRVPIGTYIAGPNTKTTRFAGLNPVVIDLGPAPPDPATGDPANYDEHQFTIVGSYKTLAPDSTLHMMTPYPGGVTDATEAAFFNASPFFDNSGAPLSRFPTTTEMALFVYDHQGDAGATLQEIVDGLFEVPTGSPLELVCHSPCEAEGTLFPHSDEDPTNNFHSLFDPTDLDETVVAVDVCLPITVDIKPNNSQNSINVGHNGDLPVAVLTTDDFDAVDELDPETLAAVLLDDHGQIVPGSEVYADHWAEEDVDGDGDLDVILHFSVEDLVAGDDAPLSEGSTSMAFRGDTFDGMCVEDSDTVRTVGHRH